MLKILTLVTAALVALTIPLTAQDGGPVLRVDGGRDQIVHIRAKTRHTTVIVLARKRKTCWILWSEIPNTGT